MTKVFSEDRDGYVRLGQIRRGDGFRGGGGGAARGTGLFDEVVRSDGDALEKIRALTGGGDDGPA